MVAKSICSIVCSLLHVCRCSTRGAPWVWLPWSPRPRFDHFSIVAPVAVVGSLVYRTVPIHNTGRNTGKIDVQHRIGKRVICPCQFCLLLSLSVSFCPSMSPCVPFCLLVSLSVSFCPSLSLSVPFCRPHFVPYMPLFCPVCSLCLILSWSLFGPIQIFETRKLDKVTKTQAGYVLRKIFWR